ncbi:terminase small subunit [Paenibacillus apii]|uniref:terminase small subunit n=1 Tax=Paenibacillus apii TaxID=1850370 RepID=UPI00143C1DD0|nr:terminase small subunit [Paenibacillus apii]NJJ38551.1 terminase small subunit [Paenibacillus apii]
MNAKQIAFADYYIETANGAESYKRAYPSCKSDATARTNASKLLTNPNIQNYIKERMEQKDKLRIASQDEVLSYLTQVMRGEVQDQLGFETSVRDRNNAAELLGKRYALWTEKKELTGNLGVTIVNDIPRSK